jgi:hypothetical protein
LVVMLVDHSSHIASFAKMELRYHHSDLLTICARGLMLVTKGSLCLSLADFLRCLTSARPALGLGSNIVLVSQRRGKKYGL